MRLDDLVDMLNRLNDEDREWWPFLFLRPAPEERIGAGRVLALSVLHGVALGMAANVILALSGKSTHVALLPVTMVAALFVVYQMTVAFSWNRRAAKLVPVRARASRRPPR